MSRQSHFFLPDRLFPINFPRTLLPAPELFRISWTGTQEVLPYHKLADPRKGLVAEHSGYKVSIFILCYLWYYTFFHNATCENADEEAEGHRH